MSVASSSTDTPAASTLAVLFPHLSASLRRGFIGLGYAALAVGFTVYMYLVVYLPYIARIDLAWEVYCPNMIPTATLAGVTAFFR